MMIIRHMLLLAAFGTMGLMTLANEDNPKPAIKAVKVVPAVKAKADKKEPTEAEKAKKQEEDEEAQYERDFQKSLKAAQAAAEKAASHKLHKEVKLSGKNGNSLQTLAVDPAGRVLALVAQPRGFSSSKKDVTSEVHVLDQDGKEVGVWTVNFHANAVNAGPDGTVYVAGDGKLAKFTKDGKPIGEVTELTFIKDMTKDTAKLKELAEKQLKLQKESFEKMVVQYKDRLAKLEEKEKKAKEAGEELSKTDKAQLKQFSQIVESLKQSEKFQNTQTVDQIVQSVLGRVRIINSISVNEKEMFIVCGENEGYGFGLWRMDLDLKNAKKITANMSGCCGQMDVQCCGDDVLVAENTRHRFAKYDRAGKELATGGKRGSETEPGCFGGCCNPMNVKAVGLDVLTAESEGIIKMFGPTGEFKGIVGAVAISGGCKNVAVGATADMSRVYFCDQPGGRVMILSKKEAK